MTDRIFGIDVSRWQPTVDWAAVKSAGAAFAFMKATQHYNYVDPRFTINWAESKAAGLPRGAYHFFQAGVNPQKQAEFFAQTLGNDSGELPPVLDLENAGQLGNKQIVADAKIFLDTAERLLQRKPLIYTGRIFWKDRMWWPAGQYPTWTKDYEFWVAHYTTQPEPRTHESWAGWRIWQYTETGQIGGIPGKVDLNWFNGDAETFKAWLNALSSASFALPEGDVEDYSGQPDADWAPASVEETEQLSRATFAADE